MATSVISVRGRKRAELEADPSFVYVGRATPYTLWWDAGSKWANRFSFKRYGLLALDLFAKDLDRRIEEDPAVLCLLRAELRGKTLGCWCGSWKPGDPDLGCHAVILAKLAEVA